ncbi:TetR/AcrR family transcriptional regulator [Candidatus Binatus sp.]|uniref:TetR/AcrR family transcriptional regulator n=2 Tax=Candidatus Binatus sp. TaxID=2811406 RepID=UPI003C7730EF
MRGVAKSSVGRASAKVVELRRPTDTRDRVLQVAQVLFAERGYRGTSLRDIAKRIGIKAPSLLHHFPSKQLLYLAVLDKMFESLEDAANAIAWGRENRQERMRQAVGNAIDFIAMHPDFVRIMWKEMADESGIGRQVLKRRLPPLFSTAVNFIFRGQRDGEFRPEVDPLHFMWSLNSITIGYFTTAAMLRRLWGMNLLEPAMIERRKREVIDMVERTLFTTVQEPSGQ